MASNSADRFQRLFMYIEEPRRPLFSPAVQTASPERISSISSISQKPPYPQPAVFRYPSNASTTSSASSYTNSNSSWGRKASMGRRYSTSSAATSISIPPWHPPTLVQHLTMRPYNYGYDLPCEFFFIGCNLRFDPADFEAWISHTASHLRDNPPQTAICTLCDDDEAVFHSNGDGLSNWRDRMLHIGDHLQSFTPSDHIRPDYWVIEHMWNNGLISPEDYAHALKGTERPYCANLVDRDFETPEMLNRKAKELQQPHDLGSEKRRIERESKKGKSTHKSSHAHRPRKSYNPRVEKER